MFFFLFESLPYKKGKQEKIKINLEEYFILQKLYPNSVLIILSFILFCKSVPHPRHSVRDPCQLFVADA